MLLSYKDHKNDERLKDWATELGVPASPDRLRAIATSLKFFEAKMPRLKLEDAEDFLRATDTSRAVKSIYLVLNERVIAFRKAGEAEFKLFYTRPGNSKYSSGLNPKDRTAVHFRVRISCAALESYTTGVIDTWSYPSSLSISVRKNTTGYMATGGGLQLLIPDAHRFLELIATP